MSDIATSVIERLPNEGASAYYPVGTRVWVVSWNTYQVRQCRIADVSHPRDVARHRRTKRVIEAGYEESKWI